ncbi:PREDICTED: glutaredoxin-related protein 5, mitochondrial, partial [Pterocles gutturalis]|uniref:glutaredoxin-related protein 5, mitochondrial n=1 Tax=Pterocles gutturalis TaxID=240206 RepID=UPI00052861CC
LILVVSTLTAYAKACACLFRAQGIKNYSNWPTIPQVYLNGEFVGGCDILLQMHQNGDLVEELKKLGIRSALLDAEKDQDKK